VLSVGIKINAEGAIQGDLALVDVTVSVEGPIDDLVAGTLEETPSFQYFTIWSPKTINMHHVQLSKILALKFRSSQ
jgi:hypothetical protein